MFALIKKDIIFTKKWILLSVVYAVVATWLIMHEGATNILFTFFLVPFFVTSLPFTKIMSIEDNSDTRDFIRRLPVSKYLVVFSRAVFILFMLLISSISLFVIQTIGFNVEYNTDMLIKIASIILIFLSFNEIKAISDAGVATFMNSFNDINGIPATGNNYLQRDLLKGAWGYKGFVVSDWGSWGEMIPHGFAKDNKEAALKAILAGSDMDMESRSYINHL